MSTEYTPSISEVVNAWIKHRTHHFQGVVLSDQTIQEIAGEINRRLDLDHSEAKAIALDEAAIAAFNDKKTQGLQRILIGNWLRNYAAQLKESK